MFPSFADNTTSLPNETCHFTPAAHAALNGRREGADTHTLYHVLSGSQLECQYRQIRLLRIYDGASEALLINIASSLDTQQVINREDLS